MSLTSPLVLQSTHTDLVIGRTYKRLNPQLTWWSTVTNGGREVTGESEEAQTRQPSREEKQKRDTLPGALVSHLFYAGDSFFLLFFWVRASFSTFLRTNATVRICTSPAVGVGGPDRPRLRGPHGERKCGANGSRSWAEAFRIHPEQYSTWPWLQRDRNPHRDLQVAPRERTVPSCVMDIGGWFG